MKYRDLCLCALLLVCALPLTQAGDAARVFLAKSGEHVLASASGPGVRSVAVKDAKHVQTDCGKLRSSKQLSAELKLDCDCSKAEVQFAAPSDCDSITKTKAKKGRTTVWLKSGYRVDLRAADCGQIEVDYDK